MIFFNVLVKMELSERPGCFLVTKKRIGLSMIVERDKREPGIDYPCEWIYKVIGRDRESVHNAIASIIQDNVFHMNISNTSKTGKYLSFDVSIMVCDEAYRNKIYHALKGHDDIKFVF